MAKIVIPLRWRKTLTETIGLSDSLTHQANISLTFTESISLTDNISKAVTMDLTESITVTDVVYPGLFVDLMIRTENTKPEISVTELTKPELVQTQREGI